MPSVKNAKNATIFSEYILQILRNRPDLPRPTASLGVHIANYSSQHYKQQIKGALRAVDLLSTHLSEERSVDDDLALLQTLGGQLQMNITDLLNASADRIGALNQYTETLKATAQEAQRALARLRSREEYLFTEVRSKKKQGSQIEKEIDKLMDAQDFSAAGSKQADIRRIRIELAELEVKAEQTKSTADTLEDMLFFAAERLEAISQNREAIIAGITVIELPGTKELGIFEEGKGKRSSFGKPKNGLLDFSDL